MAIFSAIGYAAAYAASALAAAAGFTFSTAVSIGVAAGNIATSLAASLVARALAPEPSIPKQEIQAVIKQSNAPRRVHFGQNLVGGIRALYDTRGTYLDQLILFNHGAITSFDHFRVDGRRVTLGSEMDAHGETVYPITSGTTHYGHPHAYLRVRDGSANGGDYGELIAKYDYWTAAHRLEGQATFYVAAGAPNPQDFNKLYPKMSETLFQWEIKGAAVYDPRTTTAAYSDNAALVTAFYLTHPGGFGLAETDMNWGNIGAMADIADLPIEQAAGGTAPNLRLWGHWTMDEKPRSVIDRLHGSCGLRPYEMQDGRIGLIGGPFGTPACTITHKDIRSLRRVPAISARKGYNKLRVFFLSDEHNYEDVEVDPWEDAARLAIEGEIPEEYRLSLCPNLSQARRLAREQFDNDNREKIEIITNLVGLKARWPRVPAQRHTILLDYRPEDGSGRVIEGEFEVVTHEFDPVGLECAITLERVIRRDPWTPAMEGEPPAPLPVETDNPPPGIFAVLTQRVVTASLNVRTATLEVDVTPVADRDDLEVQAQYREVAVGAKWRNMTVSGYSAQSDIVEDGKEYEARVRFSAGVFDGVDDWEGLGPITITVDSTPPGQPTELIPSNGSGYVHLSWRNPSGDFAEIRIYRNTVNDFPSAVLVGATGGASGQLSEYQDDTIAAATGYYYWVAAANVSGIEGTPAGPASITTP